MDDRTISDLQKLKVIEDKQRELRDEAAKIRSECPCLDYKVEGVETLSFDIKPKAICPVCEKSSNNELTVQEKVACLKQHLDYGDDSQYSEEDYIRMAVDGGFIYNSFKE